MTKKKKHNLQVQFIFQIVRLLCLIFRIKIKAIIINKRTQKICINIASICVRILIEKVGIIISLYLRKLLKYLTALKYTHIPTQHFNYGVNVPDDAFICQGAVNSKQNTRL